MGPEELREVENLCDAMMGGASDPQKSHAADLALRPFSVNFDCIPSCQYILEHSQNVFALFLGASSLTKLLTLHWHRFQVAERLKVRSYVLQYLWNHIDLPRYVIAALIQLGCRITKLGWNDHDEVRGVSNDITKFLEATPRHCTVGIQFLTQLVAEMSEQLPNRSLSVHRKVVVSFREVALLDTFKIGLAMIQQLQNGSSPLPQQEQNDLRAQALALVKTCLSYDFLGPSADESSDDLGPMQVPNSWKGVLLDPETLRLIFAVVFSQTEDSARAMACLVRFACVRRSLFTNETRPEYVGRLLSGCVSVMNNKMLLGNVEVFHQLCRFLTALRMTYQPTEFAVLEHYEEWLQLVANMTLTALRDPQWCQEGTPLSLSVGYLISLWAKFVTAYPAAGKVELGVRRYVPEITQTYVNSRLEMVKMVVAGEMDDPLADLGQVTAELDQFFQLSRCEYEMLTGFMVSLLDTRVSQYRECTVMLQNGSFNPQEMTQSKVILEHELAWLVHITGAIVGGKTNSGGGNNLAALDGQLTAHLFRLSQAMSERCAIQGGRVEQSGADPSIAVHITALEIALVSFFVSFNSQYIGDNAMVATKIYKVLEELIGMRDHKQALEFIVAKLAGNLTFWSTSEDIISHSLKLLHDFATGFSTGTVLSKLESTQSILLNHTAKNFVFLERLRNTRLRTVYYDSISRLLLTPSIERLTFEQYLQPFEHVLESFAPTGVLRTEEHMRALIGVVRDLTGIATASVYGRVYTLYFEWLYPRWFGFLAHALDVWWDAPEVTNVILKFMAEIVENRNNRILYKDTAPTGILLFKQASKMLTTIGQRIASLDGGTEPYKTKYKSVALCMSVLNRTMRGKYVIWGVFPLYDDPALDDALRAVLAMAFSIERRELMAFPKVMQVYYLMIEQVTQRHVVNLAMYPHQVWHDLLLSIHEGLQSYHTQSSRQACECMNNLATYLFENQHQTTEHVNNLKQHWDASGDIIKGIVDTLFRMLLFDAASNQWFLARPLLALILLDERYLSDVAFKLMERAAPENRAQVQQCFEKLMQNVDKTLTGGTRDAFARQIGQFRIGMAELLTKDDL